MGSLNAAFSETMRAPPSNEMKKHILAHFIFSVGFLVTITVLGWLPKNCAGCQQTQFDGNGTRPVDVHFQTDPYGSQATDVEYCSPVAANVFSQPRFGSGTLSLFLGIDGSKQPQDFGVNANLGGIARVDYATPLIADRGIGFQVGTSVAGSGNAVQVYELLGESKDRFQNFTTVGVFQRRSSGFAWGAVYDFLYQDSFDQFHLGQWRIRGSYELTATTEIGATFNLGSRSDQGRFNNTNVELEPIDQLNVYVRRQWQTGVLTTAWVGIADGHSEHNAVTGSLPRKQNQVLFGADLFCPLSRHLAIYGETNLMMPADTGAVDAFLGLEFIPGGIHRRSRSNRFRSMLPVAASPSFSTDLLLR